MSNNIVGALSISTGSNSLKAIDGNSINDGDACLVFESDGFYVYQLDGSNNSTESIPTIVQPTTNGTNKRWLLKSARYFNENVEFDKNNYLKEFC